MQMLGIWDTLGGVKLTVELFFTLNWLRVLAVPLTS
jgi:hypothetical protein